MRCAGSVTAPGGALLPGAHAAAYAQHLVESQTLGPRGYSAMSTSPFQMQQVDAQCDIRTAYRGGECGAGSGIYRMQLCSA